MMASETAKLKSLPANREGRTSHRLNYRQRFLLGGVVVGGLVVSVVLFWTLWSQEKQMAKVQFYLEAEKKVEAVKRAMANQLSVMSLVKAFYAGSVEVDRNEFKTFTDSIFEEHPDIKTLAWIPRVQSEKRHTHEEAAKKTESTRYQIIERRGKSFVPAAQREQYFPILFIEPSEKHLDILGLDLGSLPECLAAMDRAQANLGPVITYVNISGLNGESESTIYMFEGAHNEMLSSPDDSNPPHSADGFILGAFHIRDVLTRAMELLQPAGVDVYIFDVTSPEKTKLIFSHPSRIRTSPLPVLQAPPPESSAALHYSTHISVADRLLLAYCVPTDVYFSGKSKWEAPAALLAGLLITGLIVGYFILLTGRTARIEKLVAQQTQELHATEHRFHLLVENAADAFYLHDEEGRFLDVNQRACEHTGYTREELLKMIVFDIEVGFKPEEHHELIWKRPAADFPLAVHGVHRRKDGSTFPVEVRLNCLDTGGKRLILALSRDVTERKQAEEALRKEQRFLRHLIDLQERERKLMAYEIHDGLAQQLTGALFKLQGLETVQEKQDFPAARIILDDSLRLIRESVDEARRLIGGLRPPILDESGIIAAIEYLIGERRQSGGPQIEFVHQVQFHRLTPPLEVTLFRISQECLTNACRYSQSPKIRIELRQLDSRVCLMVQDWGVGFDMQTLKGERFGLRGIRERVRLLGGTVDINSFPDKGTIVIVELPLVEGDIDEDDG